MPSRSTPPPKGSFYPPNDAATYRDLLLFEERLKTNAASLQRRKSRYQLFLFQLLAVIVFLLCEVLLPPHISLLVIPYKLLLQRLLPDIYTLDTEVTLHPYFASGLLFVSVTTLVLFFASGMYSEKIGYANRYVPHANRALRSFNMYLNVRKPSLRSKFYFNPITFFFPRPDEPPNATNTTSSRSTSPSSPTRIESRSSSQSRSTALPIPPIPPATNPRGELIFSSRIDRNFQDSYERYRATFERKREERERLAKGQGWLGKLAFWRWVTSGGGIGPGGNVRATTPIRTPSSTSSKGRGAGSRSGTPPTTPGGGSGIVMRQRERGGSPARQGTGTPPGSRQRSGSPMRQGSGSRTGTPPSPGLGPGTGLGRSGSQRERGRRDIGGEGDMRTLALERSLALG